MKQLSTDDREAIRRAVEALTGVDHRIVEIRVDENGRVLVRTTLGPRDGYGHVLEAEQLANEEWSVKLIGGLVF